MLRFLVVVVALSVASVAVAAEPPGIGVFRVGMTLSDVKAAAPKAKWMQTGKREIFAPFAATFAGETFDVVYRIEPWDRSVLSFVIEDEGKPQPGACERRFVALADAVEMAFGPLDVGTANDWITGPAAPERMAVGKHSAVRMRRGDETFDASGVYTNGMDSVTLHGGDKRACNLSIVLRRSPERLLQGVLASNTLIVAEQPSASVRYHSLDSLPPVPAEAILVTVTCTVAQGQKLQACSAEGAPRDKKKYFVAAVMQATHMKVDEQTRDGQWTEMQRAKIEVRLMPRETVGITVALPPPPIPVPSKPPKAKAPLPKAKETPPDMPVLPAPAPNPLDPAAYWARQLVYTSKPRGQDLSRLYPEDARNDEVEAVIDMRCVVQADYSVICPERTITTNEENEYVAEFERAAGRIAMLFRVRETTQEGKSPVGIGFRQKIRFVLR